MSHEEPTSPPQSSPSEAAESISPNGAATGKLPTELLDWARAQFDAKEEEATLAGLREIRETGGLKLEDFIAELEQEALPRE
jgi:hypothetical protein